MNIHVSIIEDDSRVRTILTEWIERADGFKLVSQYSNVESALARLPSDKPEVVLVDINLSGQSGITCVRQLKTTLPQTQFMMLTVFEDGDHIFDALTAGASGYLLKRTPRDELLAAIREVRAGGSPMTSYIARRVVNFFQKQAPATSDVEELSTREREILRLLARGFAYKEMADTLQISIGTINTHVRRIYQKLHVSSRGEAVAKFAPFPAEPKAPEKS
ncbi:MAG TPA: response regulator transcription factor [Opitutaceae bacterium]|nr:response regulator transcription factor [Opitutaceae bacterium]